MQVKEVYAVCGCLYYLHGVDQCGLHGHIGHKPEAKEVKVGYNYPTHSGGSSS